MTEAQKFWYHRMMNVTARGFSLAAAGSGKEDIYGGWRECIWEADEENSAPEFLDDFKQMLSAIHPVPKYNVKSVKDGNAEWGYVSLLRNFVPGSEVKDGYRNRIMVMPTDAESIRFPFEIFLNSDKSVPGKMMYATAKKIS